MAGKKIGRPTKPMMQAVDASIAGDTKLLNLLVKEHRLDAHDVEARVQGRKGRPYGSGKKRTARAPSSVVEMIDGRTSIVNLLRLEAKVAALLASKDPQDVQQVRAAMENVETLRTKLREAESLLGL